MGNIKIDDKCHITENAKVMLGLPDGVEYNVIDILKEDVDFKIVLNAKEFGKDWRQFFNEDEIIVIK